MKYYKYLKNNNSAIDIEVKISDIIFKIFTILFVGVLGLSISIINIKINQENSLYKILEENTKLLENNRLQKVNIHIDPMLEFMKYSGVEFSRIKLIHFLTKMDPEYQKINLEYHNAVKTLKKNITNKTTIIDIISYLSIILIILFFLIYLYIQISILIRLKKEHNKELERNKLP